MGVDKEDPFFAGPLDTPIELLHCLLLGIIKYLLIGTVSALGTDAKQTLKSNLEGLNQSAFTTKINGHKMVQYIKSSNGKDFQAFVQIAPFVLASLVSTDLLNGWIALSNLTAHLYASEITDRRAFNKVSVQYLHSFVTSIAKTKLFSAIIKPKLHLLYHIGELLDRYGPPRLSATE
ncbi:hypothetical protein BDR26DRAFT_832403, partial [Obelidium mucronatum]